LVEIRARAEKEETTKHENWETLLDRPGVASHPRRHGPRITPWGVVFNLWAPSAGSIELLEVGCLPRRMPRDADGWYQCLSATAHVGTRYRFRINGKLIVPDPASFFQPDDVSEPNEVLDSAALRDPSCTRGAHGPRP
jgi:maltooligosyltrehalose trehalohydrolase